MSRSVRFGLIGAGFIGRSHGLAISAVGSTFPGPLRAVPHILCDLDPGRAAASARALGFAHHTTDWRRAVDEADAVIIAVPSGEHAAIARAAIAQGKPLLCEKPVGLSAAEAQSLAEAAHEAGVVHATGFTYLRAPMVGEARRIVESGRIGRPVHFTGRHNEDYLARAETPFSWRLDASIAGRWGALGDLGCHIIAIARALCGPIESLVGMSTIVHPTRQPADPASRPRQVENEDHAAALVRFARGVPGIIEASRVAHGRKMGLSFELVCEGGTLHFDAERTNELNLYVDQGDPGEVGFRRILINAEHPDYAGFLPAPGHGLGFNDLKTIELRAFLAGIESGVGVDPDLFAAARISRVCEAILDSSASGRWVAQPELVPARVEALA